MFHFFFYFFLFFFFASVQIGIGRSGTVVTRERSKINQSPHEMNQLHNHQLFTTCSNCFCHVVLVGSNHKVDSCTLYFFVSSFSPIRAPGRYCIHNPNQSHHCINISRSLSKIVKYMCTYSTYIPPRVYVPVASLLMKESSTKRRKTLIKL